MKVLLLISLCIAAAAVAHAVPLDSSTKELQELNAIIENAIQKQLENELVANEEEDQSDDHMLFNFQELLASKQSTDLAAQEWFKRLFKGGKKIFKKALKFGRRAYGIWNKYKKNICSQEESMPAEFEDAVAEAFFEQHQTAILQSLEDEVEANSDEAESEVSSEFLATYQDLPVELQGFFSKLFKNVKKIVKKGVRFGRKAYGIWNKVKGGLSCEQSADMPEELENAIVEAFMKQNAEAVTLDALEELVA